MKIKDLVGKTITAATKMCREDKDDEGWLKLQFSDGTSCVVVAGYGGYTGKSEDEYPTFIYIAEDVAGLVPAPYKE